MAKENETRLLSNIPEGIIPMDQGLLTWIDTDRAEISTAIKGIRERIKTLARCGQEIDIVDAAQLQMVVQARNIQNETSQIAVYAGMIEMLLENLTEDLNAIFKARDQFVKDYNAKIIRSRENSKKQETRAKDAEWHKAKRASK